MNWWRQIKLQWLIYMSTLLCNWCLSCILACCFLMPHVRLKPRINTQTVNLEALRQLPSGTFGREYVIFMDARVSARWICVLVSLAWGWTKITNICWYRWAALFTFQLEIFGLEFVRGVFCSINIADSYHWYFGWYSWYPIADPIISATLVLLNFKYTYNITVRKELAVISQWIGY